MSYVGKQPQPKFLGQVDDLTVAGDANITGATDIDTSLNVDGTVTADGLTVDGTENITYSRNADEFTGIELSNTNSGAGSFSGISYGTNGSGTQQWFVGRENQSSAALQFCPATAGTPTVVFEYGGNVGIGTDSPNGVLELHQGSTVAATSKTQTGYPNLIIKDSSTSFADERGAAVSFEGIYGALSKIAGVKANGSSSGSTRDFGELVFYTHGNSAESGYAALNEAMRIDSSSNLLVGKTSEGVGNVGFQARPDGFFAGTRDGGTVSYLQRQTSDGEILRFQKDNSTVGTIGAKSNDLVIGTGDTGFRFSDSLDAIIAQNTSTNSGRDNSVDLGSSSIRFDDIFATNGTIQTSDRNEKQDIATLTTAEMAVAARLSNQFKTFRWINSVTEKGDNARTHTGIIAQDVQQAFTDEGLDAGDYALFISSTWWETQTEVPAVEAVDEVLDEDGNVITKAVEAQEAYTRTDTYDTADEAPEGATERTRMGIRYPELLSFMQAYNDQRMASIEARLDALEAN